MYLNTSLDTSGVIPAFLKGSMLSTANFCEVIFSSATYSMCLVLGFFLGVDHLTGFCLDEKRNLLSISSVRS